MSRPRSIVAVASAIVGALLIVLLIGAGIYQLSRGPKPPELGSSAYDAYVAAFQVGVAALDAGLPQIAEENFSRAVEQVPQEPAGWANRGLLYLRTGRLEEAGSDLRHAARLAAGDADIEKLLGLWDQRQGRFTEAAEHLRRALAKDPNDVKAIYLLAQIVDQEQSPGSEEEYQRLMERIVAVEPDNLLARMDLLRTAASRGDTNAVKKSLEHFERLSPGWKEQTQTGLNKLKAAMSDSDGADSVNEMLQFANLLRAEPAFPRSAEALNPQDTFAGDPLTTFRWLAPVQHSPAPPDEQLMFVADTTVTFPTGDWSTALPVWLSVEGPLSVFIANKEEVQRVGHELKLPSCGAAALLAFDANNDLRTDLLAVGAQGTKLHQQQADGSFKDVTAETGLPEEVQRGDFRSAWAVDVDMDGDLDAIIARTDGPWLWLRNALDGTFAALPIFAGVKSGPQFTWADLDNDGAPDAALVDAAGKVHVFANERSGKFKAWTAPPPDEPILAVTSADVNDDGIFDLVALREDGALLALSARDDQSRWGTAELGRWNEIPTKDDAADWRVLAEDYDNNGVIDLLASGAQGSQLWLGSGGGKFSPIAAELPPGILAAADLRRAGRLDLVGIDDQRHPFVLQNKGSQDYRWQTIRPQAAKGAIEGDNRINSFGIGGEIEIRSGTHVVKQPIRSPLVHFGLGARKQVDVVRIVWPNGAAQYEFNAAVDAPLTATQRLKGSCPFLFAWNGERFEFVTDFMWSTPLGMYINASDKGGFLQTTDWVRIRGDQLVPKDGKYELRVNANLWETHYFDHLALMVVDHPGDSEMFVDERFCLEPSEPTLHLLSKPQPVAKARDHLGQDATEETRADDGVYLDRCGRGVYQGITSEHWVEVELGEVPAGPIWLVARGWIHPTDSSINYAIEQGQHVKPQALVLEVPDNQGNWQVARDRIGFPAGKNKTILLRLDGLGEKGAVPRRFRLRTNMEIYWDSLQVAQGQDDSLAQRQVLLADQADLRFRGILAMSQANPSSPELPHYDEVVGSGQTWRDLIGYHTRFGEIGELLSAVDDRYAILNAGDDVALRFTPPAGPPPGWERDFVLVSDGWVKDGDLNTRFGKTVLPLPDHDMATYDTPPGDLEADPVYRRYPEDWQKYHTRFVSPQAFKRGLRGFCPRESGPTGTP